MENAFRRLEEQVPPPEMRPFRDGFVFRYKEESIQQALLLKLVRYVSGLHAVDALLARGLVQEQAAIQRILDEIQEDIYFLAVALTNDQVTARHQQYLKAFYAETFPDPNNVMTRGKKPDMVPRKKIRAYVHRILSKDADASRMSDISEILSTVYSGFVHASADSILDTYGGNPPRFHLSGMLGTPRVDQHVYDAWNYYYRGLQSVAIVGKAFGDKPLVDGLYAYFDKFLATSREKYGRKC